MSAILYVTHDQIEALTLADRIAVMDRARLPRTAARRRSCTSGPRTEFTASFVGNANLLPVTVTERGPHGDGSSGAGTDRGRDRPRPPAPSRGGREHGHAVPARRTSWSGRRRGPRQRPARHGRPRCSGAARPTGCSSTWTATGSRPMCANCGSPGARRRGDAALRRRGRGAAPAGGTAGAGDGVRTMAGTPPVTRTPLPPRRGRTGNRGAGGSRWLAPPRSAAWPWSTARRSCSLGAGLPAIRSYPRASSRSASTGQPAGPQQSLHTVTASVLRTPCRTQALATVIQGTTIAGWPSAPPPAASSSGFAARAGHRVRTVPRRRRRSPRFIDVFLVVPVVPDHRSRSLPLRPGRHGPHRRLDGPDRRAPRGPFHFLDHSPWGVCSPRSPTSRPS